MDEEHKNVTTIREPSVPDEELSRKTKESSDDIKEMVTQVEETMKEVVPTSQINSQDDEAFRNENCENSVMTVDDLDMKKRDVILVSDEENSINQGTIPVRLGTENNISLGTAGDTWEPHTNHITALHKEHVVQALPEDILHDESQTEFSLSRHKDCESFDEDSNSSSENFEHDSLGNSQPSESETMLPISEMHIDDTELCMTDSVCIEKILECLMLDGSKNDSHNLYKMFRGLQESNSTLQKETLRLRGELDRLQADQSSSIYTAQIEYLEKSLAQAQVDAHSWEWKLKETEEKRMRENIEVRSDLTNRLERVTKQLETATREKESMVIKFACSEKEVILAKRLKENIEKKIKDMEKDREAYLNKIKVLNGEKTRICLTMDSKVQECNSLHRELDKLKEEVSSRDVKIKWAQTKLKTEMEAHKDTQGRLDRSLQKITKHEDELRIIKEEAERIVRDAHENEHTRANVLDMQLKEEKARLIMERQLNDDRDSALKQATSECEKVKETYALLKEENAFMKSKLSVYESEREESEKLFVSLRNEVASARQQVVDLKNQLANTAHFEQQLQREREQLEASQQEVEQLQTLNRELESDLLGCRQKEAELLNFTQKLSDKNAQIQSQLSGFQTKVKELENINCEIKEKLTDTEQLKLRLEKELFLEKESGKVNVERLTQQLREEMEKVMKLTTKASDLENEMVVLKKKHNNSLKDLTREMQKLRKRADASDSGMLGSVTLNDTLSQGSRASSNTSLNAVEYHNGSAIPNQELAGPVSDPVAMQRLLVDRIVKLQKSSARRQEKIDFLEEHVAQLLGELKKKSKIIHHYIMKEEAGALVNSASDSSKAEILKHGGIMASVYGSAPLDGAMTLDLSLEINRKLQAVLEDTLLKNITLKDNLATLGDEIARLSQTCQSSD
ncbi:coiled-coil domain-containing protein 186-like isoform X2 [Oratosquilla oratoria]|uniref:coiled-coil domain-containing protein 186-like isoform X2 n=1 Tax=Oratosquilla oratoria TaxID=337810 RepID=UPI003F75FE17